MKKHIHFDFSVFLIAFLLLTSSAFCKDNWFRFNSKNFTVISNADQKDIRRVAERLETFRTVFLQLLPKVRTNASIPNTVVLFKSHDSFRPFKPKYKGKTRDNVGGYFLAGWNGNYIALTAEKDGRDPLEIIFHEFVHYIINSNLKNAPLWLNEGLAEYYSTFELSDDGKFVIGTPIPRHIFALKSKPLLSLDKLLAVDHKSPDYNESSKVGVFYAESWALVHYMFNGMKDGKGRAQLTDFLRQLAMGKKTDAAFQQSFQTDYKTFESDLRGYIRQYLFPVLIGRLPANFSAKADQPATAEQMTDVDAQFYLGSLQQRVGRFDEAVERFEKIHQLDANHVPGMISLGSVRTSQDRLDEAKELLESAIKAEPDNYLGHFYYGELLSKQEKYMEAIACFKQAGQLKPDSAWVQSEMSQAYLSAGMEKESNEAFMQALRLDPTNEGLMRRRAYDCLAAHRGDQAARAAIGYINQQGWSDQSANYMALAAYFGLREADKGAAAEKLLAETLKVADNTEWVFSVLQYLNHTLTADELLAKAANDIDKLTEAHAYIGLDLSLNGHGENARQHLVWVKEKGNKNFVEYPLATAELKRMESAENISPK